MRHYKPTCQRCSGGTYETEETQLVTARITTLGLPEYEMKGNPCYRWITTYLDVGNIKVHIHQFFVEGCKSGSRTVVRDDHCDRNKDAYPASVKSVIIPTSSWVPRWSRSQVIKTSSRAAVKKKMVNLDPGCHVKLV